jgi:hypothetical protein
MEPNTETQINKTSETPTPPKPVNDSSTIFGVSIRGWIAIVVIFTVCLMSGLKIAITEPLYTLAGLIIGFYFGQNPKKQ